MKRIWLALVAAIAIATAIAAWFFRDAITMRAPSAALREASAAPSPGP